MKISIIVAMSENRVIGKDHKLPWHISEDLRRFKKLTMGCPVIMGRKTYESIGKPLPGRTNIILTRGPSFSVEGALVFDQFEKALKSCEQTHAKEVFIIGGAEVYATALPMADRVYLTRVKGTFDGDTFFPDVRLEDRFNIVDREDHPTYSWVVFHKK